MKERKRNYRFHDPNPPQAAAAVLLKILMEAGAARVERVLAGEEELPEKGPEKTKKAG